MFAWDECDLIMLLFGQGMGIGMVTFVAMLLGAPGALVVVLTIICLLWLAVTARAQDGKAKEPAQPTAVTANAIKSLSRADIQQRLGKLLKTPAPQVLKEGAMCYEMAAPPNRAEYVCPKCGEKTLYTQSAAKIVAWEIPTFRRCLNDIQGLVVKGLSLDESQFCRKCSPDVKEPKLVLKIEYEGGKPHTLEGVDAGDLLILKEFLSGKLAHNDGPSGEKPLKDYSRRLQELLGVTQP